MVLLVDRHYFDMVHSSGKRMERGLITGRHY